jgi:hypothetical protein
LGTLLSSHVFFCNNPQQKWILRLMVALHPVVPFSHLVEVPLCRSMGRSIPVNLVEIRTDRERDALDYMVADWHRQMFSHWTPNAAAGVVDAQG